MNRRDLQNIFDMVLDIGESPLHRVSFAYSDISSIIYIHLKSAHDEVGNVCATLHIYADDELRAEYIEWLTNWKAVFETERVAYETN